MINLLSEEQQKQYQEFVDFMDKNVQPYAADWEKSEIIPRDIIDLCAKAGYIGGAMPVELGGLGWDHVTYGIFTAAVAKASTSFAGLFNVHTMVMKSIDKWGTPAQKEKWLPSMIKGEVLGAFALTEPEAGSDIKGIQTSFVEKDDNVIINGTKRWITFGGMADVFLLFGKLNGEDDKPTAILVDKNTPGVKVNRIDNMIGFKAAALAVLEFHDVEVPKENIVAKPGFAFSCISPFALEYGRISVAYTALGIMRGCLEVCSSHVLKRTTFGDKLISRSTIKEMITTMGVDYTAACSLCIHACQMKDEHNPISADEVLAAKYFATKAARKHADDAVQIMGATGCNESHPVSRYFRDSKVLEIIEGSNQIIEMLLGSSFTRKYKK